MQTPQTLILYVDDVASSAAFFNKTFGARIVESSPNFGMLVLSTGLTLGLWAHHDVAPAARPSGGFELCLALESDAAVDAALVEARSLATVIQEPTHLDFGYTFVFATTDHHRIRVFHAAS